MNESTLIDKFRPHTKAFINKHDKVSNLLILLGSEIFRVFKIFCQTTLLIKLVFFLFLLIITKIKLLGNFYS